MMTALAMIIGMVPMAIGMGEGGEQNAPLGRAVIGELLYATIATLFFVPVVFAIVRHQKIQNSWNVMSKDPKTSDKDQHPPRSGKRLLWFLLIPVVLATGSFFVARARQEETQQLGVTTKSLEVQTGNVIHPQRGKTSSDLTLPGAIQAFSQSPIFARGGG